MQDPSGTNQELIKEISALKQRIRELEYLESEHKRVEEALRSSEAFLNCIIECSPEAIWISDSQGTLVRLNQACRELLHITDDEVVGKYNILQDTIVIEQGYLPLVKQVFEKGMSAKFTIKYDSKQLKTIELNKHVSVILDVTITPIRDATGRIINATIQHIDITARRRAEEACRDAEVRYHTLFEQSPNGILLLDTETGKTIEANETASRQLGYTREEFAALRISDYEALEGPYETTAHIQKVIRDGSDDFETLHRTKGGEIRNVHVWVKSVRLSDRGFFYAIFQDITAEKRAEEGQHRNRKTAERLAEEMAVIAEIGRLINSSLDIDKVYQSFALQAQKLVRFDRLSIDLNNPDEGTFTVTYVSGTDIPGRRSGDTAPIAGTISEAILRKRTGLLINTAGVEEITGQLPYVTNVATLRAGMRSMISVPLISGDKVIGALHFRLKKPNAYTEKDLRLGERIGAQIAGAIFNAQIVSKLRKAVNTTIQAMVSAVDVRDPYTAGHQIRSADLARTIATEMGLPQEKIDAIRIAGSIHDIGKLSIPAEILSKPTKLLEIEFALIKEHARRGFEMLKDVESPWPLAEIVYQHHERMDGSGYPRKLKGEDILIEARILSVADVVEAMASHRPYRPGMGIDAALNEIERNRGIFYDNAVADACLKLFREKGFQFAET